MDGPPSAVRRYTAAVVREVLSYQHQAVIDNFRQILGLKIAMINYLSLLVRSMAKKNDHGRSGRVSATNYYTCLTACTSLSHSRLM